MLEKICTICNKSYKVLNQEDFKKFFHKAKAGKYGFTARCKPCRHKVEVIPHAEKRKEYDKNRYTIKGSLRPCIVCGKEFRSYRENHKTCSYECYKLKKKVYQRIYRKENLEKIKKEQKEVLENATNRNKHYSKNEISIISNMLAKGYSKKRIAKKLNRTPRGICAVAKRLKENKC